MLFPVILHLEFYLHSSGIKSQFPLLSVKTNKQKQRNKPPSCRSWNHYPNHCKETNIRVPRDTSSHPAPCKLEKGFGEKTFSWSCREISKQMLFCNESFFCKCNKLVMESASPVLEAGQHRGAGSRQRSSLFQM